MTTTPVSTMVRPVGERARLAVEHAEQAAAARAAGIAESNRLRISGQPGRAHYRLMRCWLEQLRILGWSHAGIPGRYDLDGGVR